MSADPGSSNVTHLPVTVETAVAAMVGQLAQVEFFEWIAPYLGDDLAEVVPFPEVAPAPEDGSA